MRLQKRNRRHKWKHTDDSHIWHCLTSPNIRRKIRRCDCLHGTFSMWFWVRFFNRMHVCAFFLFGVFAVCLLRDYRLNWVQILMGLMCHLFIFCVLDFLTEKKKQTARPLPNDCRLRWWSFNNFGFVIRWSEVCQIQSKVINKTIK